MHGPVSSQVPKSSSFKKDKKTTTRKTRRIRIELFLSFFSLFVSWVSLRIRYPWHAGFCAQMAPLFFKYIFGRPIKLGAQSVRGRTRQQLFSVPFLFSGALPIRAHITQIWCFRSHRSSLNYRVKKRAIRFFGEKKLQQFVHWWTE